MRCEHLIKLITILFMQLMLSFVACGVENKTQKKIDATSTRYTITVDGYKNETILYVHNVHIY